MDLRQKFRMKRRRRRSWQKAVSFHCRADIFNDVSFQTLFPPAARLARPATVTVHPRTLPPPPTTTINKKNLYYMHNFWRCRAAQWGAKASKAELPSADTDGLRWERTAHQSGFHCRALILGRLKERFGMGWRRVRGSRVVETEGKETSPRGWCQGKGCKGKKNTQNIFPFLFLTKWLNPSVRLSAPPPPPQLWEIHRGSVIACLYLRNALSGLRALLISGGLDWLLSAEHTRRRAPTSAKLENID